MSSPGALVLRDRAWWGADETIGGHETVEWTVPRAIVVHHSKRAEDLEARTALSRIHRFHVIDRGWNDIGYHFAIAADGETAIARRSPDPLGDDGRVVVGAHAWGANRNSIGVVMLGDFDAHGPTAAAWESLAVLCRALCDRHDIDPAGGPLTLGSVRVPGPITGHGETRPAGVTPTTCPGATVRNGLDALVAALADHPDDRSPGRV